MTVTHQMRKWYMQRALARVDIDVDQALKYPSKAALKKMFADAAENTARQQQPADASAMRKAPR